MNRRHVLLVAGLAASTLALGAAQAQEQIVVYNAQHASLTEAWAAGFTKDTGVKVVIRKGSDNELGAQIVQEGAASPADVFLTENSPAMMLVERAGLFAELPKDVLDAVPDQFRPTSGRWVGIAARSTVFVYDKAKLKEADLPKTMAELAEPKWKGRWAASPSGADFQAIVGAYLTLKGEAATAEWLKAMKTNAKPYRGNGAAMKGVNSGEADGALIYHYYYFGDQAKTGENSDKVAQHYFRNKDPGAFLSISGGGVLASSKNRKGAEAFLRWIVGKAGQGILRDGDSFEYAIARGEASNPKLEPIARLDIPAVEPSKLDSKKVTELMMAAGLL